MKFISIQGLVPYDEARELQRTWVEMRARDEVPDTVFFLEHAPVITRGRGLQRKPGEVAKPSMPLNIGALKGIEYAESERGGDLTYHGPGQLVAYPIFKLGQGPLKDIQTYLRFLEQVLIQTLAQFEIRSRVIEGATGVWVGDRKIASIGIAVRKWITSHGIALNVVNDLAPFRLFSPCGFNPEVMTSMRELKDFLFSNLEVQEWRKRIEAELLKNILIGAGISSKPAFIEVEWGSFLADQGLPLMSHERAQ